MASQNVLGELAKIKRIMPSVFDALLAAAESGEMDDAEIAAEVAECLRVDTTWTPDPVPDVPEPVEEGPAKKEWRAAFIKRAPAKHTAQYERNIATLNRMKNAVRPD